MVIKSDNKLPHLPTNPEARSAIRQALPQILAVSVKNVLLLGFGMTLGFPTILIPSLSGNDPNEDISLGQETISWIGSVNLICVPVGCLLSGMITQPIGRKRAMQFVNIPFLTAWLLFHFSTEVWQIFLALCITGLAGGLLEAPTLTYVAEITDPSLRGILASTSTIAVTAGTLLEFFLGTFFHWKTVALISCSLPIISFILLLFIPESPFWLITKRRFKEAQKSFAWLRGWIDIKDIQEEFQQACLQLNKIPENMSVSETKEQIRKRTMLENAMLFTKKPFLWPFGIVCFMFFLGHFSGMTTLQTYAVKIFASLRSPIDKYYATIFLGLAQVCGCLLSVTLVHFVGKRKMNLFSLIGCTASFLIMATFAYLINVNYLIDSQYSNFNGNSTADSPYNYLETQTWIPMTLVILTAFFFYTGIRILPWMLLGEVFATEVRPMGAGICGALSYVIAFLLNKTFLQLTDALTLPGVFWLYGGSAGIGIIIVYFILPETEGKTLFEIERHFRGEGKLSNKVNVRKQNLANNGKINEGFNNKDEVFESRL